jgi:transposase InsO family protein
MVNYLKRYTPVLSEVTTPLRELVKDDIVYQWEPRHEVAFQQIKEVLTSTPVLAYFDASKSHIIQTDASEKGLGGVLLQEGRPVMYISRSLTPTEANYSNIERELLSLVFGMERLHNFVYGGKTLVQTDHKPLESIFRQAVSETTPRLQRLMLRLHRYDIQVEYLKGKENVIADALSRVSPLPPSQSDMEHTDLVPINHLEEMQERGTDNMKKLRVETALDPALQQMKLYVTQGWPERIQGCDEAVRPFWTYKEQVSLENGILYKDSRVIVPYTMRPKMLQDLHAAHQGEEKTMSLARTYLFWNGMTGDITEMVKTCPTCQRHKPAMQKELLYPHEVPAGPWEKLGMDLFEFQGAHYLLIADYFSKFPIARKLKSMTSAEVIGHCKEIFSEYGVPRTVYTDQGTQFASAEFKHLAEKYRFSVEHSSPHHPQANGFAEAMVKVVKNLWIKATEAHEDPHLALLYYRATPVKPGLASPAELLMARKIRTLIPVRATLNGDQEKARQAAQAGKDAQKMNFDKRARVYNSMILHQAIRFQKDPRKGIWTDGTIVQLPTPQQPRSYVVQQDDGSRYQRNETYIKGRVLKQVRLTESEYAKAIAGGRQFVNPAQVVKFTTAVPRDEPPEVIPKDDAKDTTPAPTVPPPGRTMMTRSRTAAESQPRRSLRNQED